MSVLLLSITATAGDQKIDVTYPSNVVGATSYRVTATELLGGAAPSATDVKQAGALGVGSATLGGLVNGRDYLVEVFALAGTTIIAKGTATAQPTSPVTIVSVVPGDHKLTVQYSVKTSLGGNSVKVDVNAAGAASGSATGVLPTGAASVVGLDNGVEYTITVAVLDASMPPNTLGTAQAKATPAAPLVVTAVPADARIDVSWVLTTVLAGHARYRVTLNPGGATQTTTNTTTLSATFTGLTNGTTYTITVDALDIGTTVLTSASATATPTSPLKVTAVPGDRKITVVYAVTGPIAGTPATFEISSTPVSQTIVRLLTDVPSGVLTNLANGTPYTVRVVAKNAAQTVLATATALATPAGSVSLDLPPFDLHPLTVSSLDAARRRRALFEARRVGCKWRYDHLKAQVLAAVDQASVFELELQNLMSLDVNKNFAAQELLPPYLLKLTSDLQSLLGKVQQVPIPDVDDSVKTLADAINTFALLERLLDWLITNDALKFWVELFRKLIDDIASFDVGLSRTRRYLRDAFGTADLQAAITSMFQDAKAEIEGFVDDAAAPLRSGIGEAISNAAGALQAVFQSFDEPLLVNSGAPGARGVTAPNPLDVLSEQLLQAVEEVIRKVREEVQRALDLASSATAAAALFEAIMTTYVLLPILAALVIGLAGGPLAAAALAFVVTVAAQELLHLLARWLAGPLRGQLETARGKIEEALGLVRQSIATPFADLLGATTTTKPGLDLGWVAGQLGSLRDLLPEVYVERAAALLEDARDAVLATAVDLAVAAEQALGLENATVFDEISRAYASELPPAPRLPGGLGGGAFATGGLVRDLGRLEERRVHLFDGKETELTLRLSLFRELGGQGDPAKPGTADFVAGEFARLLRGEEVAVQLLESALLERGYPGVYRALISEVKARAIFDGPLPPSLADINLPLQLLHLGVSRTRVRPDARGSAIINQEKWGPGTYLEPDRDPEISALGFATLVRELPSEAVTLNLIVESVRAGATSPAAAVLPRSTLPLSQNAQYRPFENRGLEGTFLLALPAAQTLPALGDTDMLFGGVNVPKLVDVVLDVTIRACHDADLAAEIRGRRRQRTNTLGAASALLTAGTTLQLGSVVPQPAASNNRTLHFSLRGHRDDVLRFLQGYLPEYQAANQSLPATGATWTSVLTAQPLQSNAAFKPLPLDKPTGASTELPKFALRFSATPSSIANGTDLARLGREIVITPDVLGVSADMLAQTPPGAGIVGLGVSVIPTPAGATVLNEVPVANKTPWGTGGIKDAALATLTGEINAGVLGGTAGAFWASPNHFGVWEPFAAAGPTGAPAAKTRLALTQSKGKLHAAVLDATGTPYYSKRDGTWSAWEKIPSGFTAVPNYSSIGVSDANGDIHAVTTDPSRKLWHAKRFPTGWSAWGDVLHPSAAGRLVGSGTWSVWGAIEADCVERDGELYVFISAVEFYTTPPSNTYVWPGASICYAIRHNDGSWSGWKRAGLGTFFSFYTAIGVTRIGRDIHVCWTDSNGNVYHASLPPSGAASSQTDVTSKAGKPGTFSRVRCTAAGGDLLLVGVTAAGLAYLTRRRSNGAWDPWKLITDLAGVTLQVSDPLSSLTLLAAGAVGTVLPTFKTATNPGRLTISDVGTPGGLPSVDLKTLFADPASRLEFDLDAVLNQGLIYDVIFSLTYAVPVQAVTPTP